MKKNLLILLMCVSTAALLSGCGDKCQGEPISIYNNGMTFYLVNKETQENLYPIDNPSPDYNADDVKLLNDNLKKTTLEKLESNGVFSFDLRNVHEGTKEDLVSQQEELCKNYYLYLNEKDTDTLQICYQTIRTECGSEYFKYYKVFYNDQLSFEYTKDESEEKHFKNVKLEKENE